VRFVKAVDAHHYTYYLTTTTNNKVNYCSYVPVKAATEELYLGGVYLAVRGEQLLSC